MLAVNFIPLVLSSGRTWCNKALLGAENTGHLQIHIRKLKMEAAEQERLCRHPIADIQQNSPASTLRGGDGRNWQVDFGVIGCRKRMTLEQESKPSVRRCGWSYFSDAEARHFKSFSTCNRRAAGVLVASSLLPPAADAGRTGRSALSSAHH